MLLEALERKVSRIVAAAKIFTAEITETTELFLNFASNNSFFSVLSASSAVNVLRANRWLVKMCGIVGILNLTDRQVLLDEVRRMSAAIVHRGPDDDGFYLGPGVGIGMRRLSIIDLKTGRQPISNEDKTIWIVFNGEIYNYQHWRAELERKGHSFSTTTDTEVIVHLYEEYGEHCVDHLRGMFAFAIWDEKKRQLLLARDRLGIKPLYYGEIGGRLLFASELKAVLEIPEVDRKLNWYAVSHLFDSLFTPPSESIIQGVHKLEPGHVLVASPGKPVSVKSYWDVRFEPDRKRTEQDTIESLRELLKETVRLHLVSDVPVGAFLSGGIDSSAIVAEMVPLASGRLSTFSIGFSEDDYSELQFARIMAKKLGTEHHELVLEPNVLDILDDLIWHLDEPFGDSSAIPTYMVSKLAAQYGKVALSGDGGDELFAGYDKYAVELQERKFDNLVPHPVRKLLGGVAEMLPDGVRGRNFLHHLSLTGVDRCLDASSLFRPEDKKHLFENDAFHQMCDYDPVKVKAEQFRRLDGDWLSVMQYIDMKRYLAMDILTKVDRVSMAHSLEVRPPLLDHKLIEFVATIPAELQIKGGVRKYIFKQAMRGILPNTIIDRPKRGFAIPLGRWFRGKLENFVRDLLLSDTTRSRGILRPAFIERLLELHRRGKQLDLQLWTLITFEMWCRKYLDATAKSSSRQIVIPQYGRSLSPTG